MPSKNNLTRDQTGLAYTIEGEPARLHWTGEEITESTDSILARAAVLGGGERAGREEMDSRAREFLSAVLAAGPVEGRLVAERAEKAGISERALERACKAASVVKRPDGFRGVSLWEMPGTISPFSTLTQAVQ